MDKLIRDLRKISHHANNLALKVQAQSMFAEELKVHVCNIIGYYKTDPNSGETKASIRKAEEFINSYLEGCKLNEKQQNKTPRPDESSAPGERQDVV